MPRNESIKDAVGARTRLRRLSLRARRRAWSMGLEHVNPVVDQLHTTRSQSTIIVVGMHRSGTSAVTGMIEDQGFDSGAVAQDDRGDNPHGTRENLGLENLTNEILWLNWASWKKPPVGDVRFTRSQLRRWNKQLGARGPRVLKDPRILLLPELWCTTQAPTIGVVRNPIAVARSLRRREPELSESFCLELWEAYNTRLRAFLMRRPFPIVEFGGSRPLDDQVSSSLCFYGIKPERTFQFFDPELVRGAPEENEWGELVSPRLTALWDEILARAASLDATTAAQQQPT